MSVSGGPNISEQGLVFYLDAVNTKSYPNAGSVVYNLTSTTTGSMGTGTTYQSVSGSFYCDGTTNGNILLPVGMVTGSNTFTISTWVKPSAAGNVYFFGSNGTKARIALFWNSNGVANIRIDGTTVLSTSGVTNIITNRWNYTVLTWNTGTINLYVNDNPPLTATGQTLNLYSSALGVFSRLCDANSSGDEMAGYVTNFMIYNRQLNGDEILQNFNATRWRFGV